MSQIVQAGPLASDEHRAILNAPYIVMKLKEHYFPFHGARLLDLMDLAHSFLKMSGI